MFFKRKPKDTKIITSNIIQSDDMSYPLMLCIKDGKQVWLDVSTEFADKGLADGTLHLLTWSE